MSTSDPERQPLLPPAAVAPDEQLPHHDEESLLPASGDNKAAQIQERTWFNIAWNTFWAAAGILLAIVFIKGFIDAKDVDVRPVEQPFIAHILIAV